MSDPATKQCPTCSKWFMSRPQRDAHVAKRHPGPRCESGWTGDRCTFPLFHEGPHSNDGHEYQEA